MLSSFSLWLPIADSLGEGEGGYDDDESGGSGYSSIHFFSIILVLVVFTATAYLCVYHKKKVEKRATARHCTYRNDSKYARNTHKKLKTRFARQNNSCVLVFVQQLPPSLWTNPPPPLSLSLSDQRNNERLRVRRPEEKSTRFL